MKSRLTGLSVRAICAAGFLALTSGIPGLAHAQVWPLCGDSGTSEEALERRRLAQLSSACAANLDFPLLRSLSRELGPKAPSGWRVIEPSLHIVANSALPFSMNDGAMWAGKGVSSLVRGGAHADVGRFRFVLVPELVHSANGHWQLRDSTRFAPPFTPEERRGEGYVFPWYVTPNSIDLPLRHGAEGSLAIRPGQSSALVRLGAVLAGVSTENHWWGPGIHNALVLSNNAPGFPHAILRTDGPLRTRLGDVEASWLVGGLAESGYFDTTSANDLRSLSAFAVTLAPWWADNLVLGFARSVMEPTSGWGAVPLRWFSVLKGAHRAGHGPAGGPAREQIMSLFARWAAPRAGMEAYAEWGRAEFPASLRDLFVAPNHTQGYTLGFQWARPLFDSTSRLRLQGELTTIEQSSTFRDRPLGVWYTSTRIPQGYTNGGQSLGAAIGPGASSQSLAIDYFGTKTSAGVYAGRIRWHEDIRSLYPWPDYQRWCNHDVSLLWGVRGSRRTRLGDVRVDATFGNRLNAFFQVQSGCPRGDSMLDIRNNTLRLTLTPRRGR